MQRFLKFTTLGLVVFLSFHLFAQDLYPEPNTVDWGHLIAEFKGNPHTGFVATLLIIQLCFLILRTILGEFLGIYKLLVLAVLSVGATIGSNLLSGHGLLDSVIMSPATLMSYQVLMNQIVKQWKKRGEDLAFIDSNPHLSLRKSGFKKRFHEISNRLKLPRGGNHKR